MMFGTWVAIVVSGMTIGEALNCYYPRIEETYDSEGLVCKWEVSDFDYDTVNGYTLKTFDSTDNCFEAKFRELKQRP